MPVQKASPIGFQVSCSRPGCAHVAPVGITEADAREAATAAGWATVAARDVGEGSTGLPIVAHLCPTHWAETRAKLSLPDVQQEAEALRARARALIDTTTQPGAADTAVLGVAGGQEQ